MKNKKTDDPYSFKCQGMKYLFNSRKLFYLSLLVMGYFSFLYLNAYIIKSDLVIIGFLQELVTIPLMILQLFFLVLSVKIWFKDQYSIKSYSFGATVILLLSNVFTWGSFF